MKKTPYITNTTLPPSWIIRGLSTSLRLKYFKRKYANSLLLMLINSCVFRWFQETSWFPLDLCNVSRKTFKMGKMTINKRAGAIGMLVPGLFLRKVALTFKLLFIVSLILFWILCNPKKTLFWDSFSILELCLQFYRLPKTIQTLF